jgi:hypothetical protein
LTEIAWKAISVTQTRATQQGLDFFEELNRVGLLATEPRIREIQVLALRNMLDYLETGLSVTDLNRTYQRGNSNPATPADTYNAVLSWIRTYVNAISND